MCCPARRPAGQQNGAAPPISCQASGCLEAGGAIRGIGEKFSVNAATGTGSLALPLPFNPGRFAPQLQLAYHQAREMILLGCHRRNRHETRSVFLVLNIISANERENARSLWRLNIDNRAPGSGGKMAACQSTRR